MKRTMTYSVLALLCISIADAQDRPAASGPPLPRIGAAGPNYQVMTINRFISWVRRDGSIGRTPMRNDGVLYPHRTGNVVYQEGFVWAGKAFRDSAHTQPVPPHTIRVGGQTYNTGTGAGWVNGFGSTATPVDPATEGVRIYKIRRDFRQVFNDLYEAAIYYEVEQNQLPFDRIDSIRIQYARDWNDWPVHRGAPYIERNGIPGYQPPPYFYDPTVLIANNYDEPGIAGADPNSPADQVIFTIYNDLNRGITLGLYGSEPLGLEGQLTLWAYKRNDGLGDIVFQRLRLINKGGVDLGDGTKGALHIDSMYIAKWVDSDLGHFGDDLLGCDPPRNMAYTYNAYAVDAVFQRFNIAPPAIGWSLLQGPIVPGVSGDSAVFNFRSIPSKKNLPMTSFGPKFTGSGFSDPYLAQYNGTLMWWRWIQGYGSDVPSSPWRRYLHPPGVQETFFPFSGDPITQTGFIDGQRTIYSGWPGDRRFTMNSGPFRMAPGDTQEVVVAMVGGSGADNLSCITAVRFNDRYAKQLQSTRFAALSSPPPPDVKVSELDGEIVLQWGTNLDRIRQTEQHVNAGGHRFEGYVVYQLPSRTSSLSDGKKIATFDVVNGVANILDDAFDYNSGLVVPVVLQRGTDSGIQRYIRIAANALSKTGESNRLFNGQEYVFAVTAYTYSPAANAVPRSLESQPAIVVAKPQIPFGRSPSNLHGDTLAVRKTGKTSGSVTPIVIDPLAATGDEYRVGFDTTGNLRTWYLRNITKNTTVLAQQRLPGDSAVIVEGGVLLRLESPPDGLKRKDMFDTNNESEWGWKIPGGTRLMSWVGGDGFGLEGFRGAAGWESPRRLFQGGEMVVPASALKNVEIRFAPTIDTSGVFDTQHPNASYAYRYGRGFSSSPIPPLNPCIVNLTGGYAYQDYRASMPLAVYDIDANPPRRLAVGFLENNAVGGTVNCRYWPPFGVDNIGSTGPREWMFIFDSDYTGAMPVPLMQSDLLSSNAPVMYMATWTRRNNTAWSDGNTMTLHPNKPFTINDMFEYTSTPVAQSPALQKASAERTGVFPNPYYAGQTEGPFRQGRFVTFNNLPEKTTIRILNVAGQVVRTLTKQDPSQFLEWDLKNADGWLVASGMYLCYVEMPDVGATKVLKLAVIQDEVIPVVK